jgi:MarR family transcriptional regulator for hemolysin
MIWRMRRPSGNGDEGLDPDDVIDGDNLGRLLGLTGKVVREWFNEVMNRHGASLHTWIILHHGLSGESLSQRDVAGLLGIGGPSLVRHLDRLEQEGLVERRRDERDRRVVRIAVTPAGKERFRELREVARRSHAEFDSILSPEEQVQLSGLLRRVRQHFLALDEGAS